MNKLFEKFGFVFLALLFVITALSLKGCEHGEPVVPTIDRTGKIVAITVETHNTLRDVQNKYREVHDLPRSHDLSGLQGFSIWYEWRGGKEPENVEYTCDIHIAKPGRVDDNHTLTLGHEMLHCIYGSYHKKKH